MAHKYSIFVGDLSSALNHKQLAQYRVQSACDLAKEFPFNQIYTQLHLSQLMLMHQVHEANGIVATPTIAATVQPFTWAADFSITNSVNLGLAVVTADCAPILLYDPLNHACAAIHAGWRGAVAGVIANAITALEKNFNSQPDSLKAFIGPTAGACCYEIGVEVAQNILQFPFGHTTLFEKKEKIKEKKYMFDLAQFCRKQLIVAGVRIENISPEYTICTICDTRFCSYRRDGSEAHRQLTVISLQHNFHDTFTP